MKKRTIGLTLKVSLVFLIVIGLIFTVEFMEYGSLEEHLKGRTLNEMLAMAEAHEDLVLQLLEMSKHRALDFSSDGFIRDSLEKINEGDTSAVEGLNEHLIKNKMPLDKTIVGINIIDLHGRIVASTNEAEIGEDESLGDYFIEGKEGVYISDVHYPPHFVNVPGIAVSAPLTSRSSGEVLGVIVNYVSIEELNRILGVEHQKEPGARTIGLEKGETFEAYLVNREKLMITESKFVEGAPLKQLVDTLPVRQCAQGKETVDIYTNYHNREVVGASKCLPEQGWTLLAEIETYEAFMPLADIRNRAIGVVAMVFSFIVVALYLFITRVVGPITEMSAAAEKITKGDFDIQVPVKTKDEVGMLAESFNYMATELKSSSEKIKKRIDELEEFHRVTVGRELKMIELEKEIEKLKKELKKVRGDG